MAVLPLILLPHRISVEPYTGDGAEGASYGPPVTGVRCRQEGTLTVDAEGQHVGAVKVYTRLSELAQQWFGVGARVTLDPAAGGGTGHVQAVAVHADGGLGGWEHLELVVAGGGA